MSDFLHLGIDLGSITVKVVLTKSDGEILFQEYRRHGAAVRQTLMEILEKLEKLFPDKNVKGVVTGSASLDLPKMLSLPFIQEVIASSKIIHKLAPQTDVAIELGGEDAKILYFGKSIDLRMNEACAGGTGAFIDQMASLLHTDTSGLNTLASQSTSIHPIASRCGVFAKTDLVSLLNEGVSRENLAVSVLQAVVEQTIGGLACGRPIRGNVAFLGGPLHFLPELVKRFAVTLKLSPEQTLVFPNGQFMVALGAAAAAEQEKVKPELLSTLVERLEKGGKATQPIKTLPPLFKDQSDYETFKIRHSGDMIPQADLQEARGNLFLGIDLGSTTVKSVLIDSQGRVLNKTYNKNDGNPLKAIRPLLVSLLERIPPEATLRGVGTTGYGANLAQTAFDAALSEVETVAHLKAACALVPDTSYVIDIGGQDMKCLQVDDGAVADVNLNEACSSGCGAFLQTFAASLHMSMPEFVQAALFAKHPVDLGSRCTVFMNSKVKQAQKEGAQICDIAAGLCYSVIRNALYKVLRLRSPESLGNKVLVQGGSFLNDALLKVMENMVGKEVHRPNIAGHMGAYGMALMCLEREKELPPCRLNAQDLKNLSVETKALRCKGCGNKCHLTVNTFSNGKKLVSGNLCEKGGSSAGTKKPKPPSVYEWKARHLFDFEPLAEDSAPRGRLGIPRVLNIYERYPFWFTLFTQLGFRVELSPFSSKSMYGMGIASMPSQAVCFPAKISHGHISWFLERKVPQIFFPCIPREKMDFQGMDDCYSCPVACGYPELVRLNTDELQGSGTVLHTPYVRPDDDKSLAKTISACFSIPKSEVGAAIRQARKAQAQYLEELHAEGKRILDLVKEKRCTGVVLCGRPYHVDPLVHHGIPELISSLGAAVLSEDSIAWLAKDEKVDLRVTDQWSFPSRLYRAARVVAEEEFLELVQLTSFGCGIDAVTIDQTGEILRKAHKLHTLIKIDEGQSLGAAKIRIRSLLATVDERRRRHSKRAGKKSVFEAKPAIFTKGMRETHTIVVPQMSPLHFDVAEGMFRGGGYNCALLPKVSAAAIETGLRYVHNDACYPAQVVIGQLIHALESGEVDPRRSALLLSQTCGPCRATNYPALLKKALQEAGFANIPVLALQTMPNSEDMQPGFSVSSKLASNLFKAVIYGDMLQRLSQHSETYELNKGDTQETLSRWRQLLKESFAAGDKRDLGDDMQALVKDFASIPMSKEERPKVGIIGEILLCYHPDANRNIAELTRREGGEPVLADMLDFFLYCFSDPIYQWQKLGGKALPAFLGWYFIQKFDRMRNAARKALAGTRFPQLAKFKDLMKNAGKVISMGYQAGEGWLLASELLKFISVGTTNALCLQPFGCLPNHIAGRGAFKELKRLAPDANFLAMDYEAGTCDANLINRVKLFMTMALENASGQKS